MNRRAPIIIGGMGGSGTRVVAKLLQAAGVYFHAYQNDALDNVFFARLISCHPQLWKLPHHKLRMRFNAFTRLYFGKPLSPLQLMQVFRSLNKPRLKQTWLLLRRSFEYRRASATFTHWAFKNPRTQFFIPQLAEHFDECQYIHVIRNGLDMAFSSNTNQLELWGCDFEIVENAPLPVRQLDFWIAINKWVRHQCHVHLPRRHHFLFFDKLCTHSEEEIAKLFRFLNLQPTTTPADLAAIVKTPASLGRHTAHLDMFLPEQIQAVRDSGFDVLFT